MPPIPTQTKLPRFYKRYPSKIKAPPVQPGHRAEYVGRTKTLRKPLKQARLGAKMVGRAVRTSFRETFPRASKVAGRVAKTAVKASRSLYKRFREAARPGLGKTVTTVGKSRVGLKKATRSILERGRANKALNPFQRKQLSLLHRDVRKGSK